jgi:hypothetical protein
MYHAAYGRHIIMMFSIYMRMHVYSFHTIESWYGTLIWMCDGHEELIVKLVLITCLRVCHRTPTLLFPAYSRM